MIGLANSSRPCLALSVIYLGTFIAYVIVRNKAVESHEKVFTPDWFRYEAANIGSRVGLKISTERKEDYEKGPPVDLIAVAAEEEHLNQANLLTARQSPGYILVKELIAEMCDAAQRPRGARLHPAGGDGAASHRRRVAQRQRPATASRAT